MAKQLDLLGRVKRQVRKRGREAGSLSLIHLGATYAGALVLYSLAGIWVDKKLGTSPLFTLIGAALGAVGGFIWIYREVLRAEAAARDRKEMSSEIESESE